MKEKLRTIHTFLFIAFFTYKHCATASPSLIKTLDLLHKYKIILSSSCITKYNNTTNKIEVVKVTTSRHKNLYKTAAEVEKKILCTLLTNENFSPEIEQVVQDFNKNLCGVDNHGFIKYSPLDYIDANALNVVQEEIEKNFKLVNTANKTLSNKRIYSDVIFSCGICSKAFNTTSAKQKALTQGLEDFIDTIVPEHIQRLHERLNISPQNED